MDDSSHTLASMEAKLDAMQTLLEHTHNNTVVLYKRMAALAHMVECLAQERTARMTDSMRAEIDATLYPDEFEALAREDKQEFIKRYGERIHERVSKSGAKSICHFGALAPMNEHNKTSLQ